VKFFRKLLLARDHVQRRARNTGKPQPVAPFNDFERLHHSITYPYVQVESNEYAAIKASFDRKPRATVRGGI
jgi:hypothetical protein